MAVPQLFRDHFEHRHGCTLEELRSFPARVRHLSEGDASSPTPEIVGRGYVYFGKGVNAQEKDLENKRILAKW
jgi:hypothetical protein